MAIAGGRFGCGKRRMSSAVRIIWYQHHPWVRWREVELPSLGAVKERTNSRETSTKWNFVREWTNWPLFPMTSVLIFKAMGSACQSNAIYSSPVLLKRCRNCLCGAFGSAVLWIYFKPSPVYFNCSWSLLSTIVHHFQMKWYSSILKLV